MRRQKEAKRLINNDGDTGTWVTVYCDVEYLSTSTVSSPSTTTPTLAKPAGAIATTTLEDLSVLFDADC